MGGNLLYLTLIFLKGVFTYGILQTVRVFLPLEKHSKLPSHELHYFFVREFQFFKDFM